MFDFYFWEPHLFNLRTYGIDVVRTLVLVVIFSRVAAWVIDFLSRFSEAKDKHGAGVVRSESDKHRQAMYQVTHYTVQILIWTVGIIMAIEKMGVNLSAVALPATVLATGIGFGVQTIFRDFASGLLLVMERWYGVGDTVRFTTIGSDEGSKGTVELISLRITQIRNEDGNLITVPNGQISQSQVVNMSRDWAKATVEFPVPVGMTPKDVAEVIEESMEALLSDSAIMSRYVTEAPTVSTRVTMDGMAVVVTAITEPGAQFDVQQEILKKGTIDMEQAKILEGLNK